MCIHIWATCMHHVDFKSIDALLEQRTILSSPGRRSPGNRQYRTLLDVEIVSSSVPPQVQDKPRKNRQ